MSTFTALTRAREISVAVTVSNGGIKNVAAYTATTDVLIAPYMTGFSGGAANDKWQVATAVYGNGTDGVILSGIGTDDFPLDGFANCYAIKAGFTVYFSIAKSSGGAGSLTGVLTVYERN